MSVYIQNRNPTWAICIEPEILMEPEKKGNYLVITAENTNLREKLVSKVQEILKEHEVLSEEYKFLLAGDRNATSCPKESGYYKESGLRPNGFNFFGCKKYSGSARLLLDGEKENIESAYIALGFTRLDTEKQRLKREA